MGKQLIKILKSYSALKTIFLSIAIISLSGCAVHKASFDCSNGKGMGCGSMTDVHKAIKNNNFKPQVETQNYLKPTKGCTSCQKSNFNNEVNNEVNIDSATYNKQNINLTKSRVSRTQDKIMKIWFNGYFDEKNNFHDSQYIYTILEPAKWIVNGPEKL